LWYNDDDDPRELRKLWSRRQRVEVLSLKTVQEIEQEMYQGTGKNWNSFENSESSELLWLATEGTTAMWWGIHIVAVEIDLALKSTVIDFE